MAKLPGGERRIVVETTCATTKAGFEEAFSKFDRSWPVIFETGTHCRWMDKCFRALGFKDIIANPGKIPSITKSNKKNDRNDARELARLAIADPEMLHPVFLRDEIFQKMLRYHHARNMLVSQRTQTINQIRGFAKSVGYRIALYGVCPHRIRVPAELLLTTPLSPPYPRTTRPPCNRTIDQSEQFPKSTALPAYQSPQPHHFHPTTQV